MPDKTKNYKLNMPLQEEFYDVDVFNENTEIIDKALEDKFDKTGGEIYGSIIVRYQIKIKNYKVPDIFYIHNQATSDLRGVLEIGVKDEDDDDINIIRIHAVGKCVQVERPIIMQGKGFAYALELYGEQDDSNVGNTSNGGYLDFHFGQALSAASATTQNPGQINDYTTRIIENAAGRLDITAHNENNKAILSVNGKRVYDDSRITFTETDNIVPGATPLNWRDIVFVLEPLT